MTSKDIFENNNRNNIFDRNRFDRKNRFDSSRTWNYKLTKGCLSPRIKSATLLCQYSPNKKRDQVNHRWRSATVSNISHMGTKLNVAANKNWLMLVFEKICNLCMFYEFKLSKKERRRSFEILRNVKKTENKNEINYKHWLVKHVRISPLLALAWRETPQKRWARIPSWGDNPKKMKKNEEKWKWKKEKKMIIWNFFLLFFGKLSINERSNEKKCVTFSISVIGFCMNLIYWE